MATEANPMKTASPPAPRRERDSVEVRAMLLQHGVALSVILDILVDRGIVTRDEIAARADRLRQDLGLGGGSSGPAR
jgi:hypothetical protein